MNRVTDFYKNYPDILLLHGISKFGPESNIPTGSTLFDQIQFSINPSNVKLSTSSYKVGISNPQLNLVGNVGIIISDGEIIYKSPDDTGLRAETIDQISIMPNFEWDKVINGNPSSYNEIILKEPSICGIYYSSLGDYQECELFSASKKLNLPLYLLTEDGFREVIFKEERKQISFKNVPLKKVSDFIIE